MAEQVVSLLTEQTLVLLIHEDAEHTSPKLTQNRCERKEGYCISNTVYDFK